MTNNVTRLEPNTMAVFFSMDVDPGFYVKLCNEGSLLSTVLNGLFMREPDEEGKAEAKRVADELRESGSVDFEDGWIALRVGMAEVTAFLMEKIGAAKQDERWSDQERYKELKAREAAETRFVALRAALLDALGGDAPKVVAAAA